MVESRITDNILNLPSPRKQYAVKYGSADGQGYWYEHNKEMEIYPSLPPYTLEVVNNFRTHIFGGVDHH
jgi:hypothetical protein